MVYFSGWQPFSVTVAEVRFWPCFLIAIFEALLIAEVVQAFKEI